jgi:hypothetical protein
MSTTGKRVIDEAVGAVAVDVARRQREHGAACCARMLRVAS